MKYTIDGKPAYQVAKENGVCRMTFHTRIFNGMSVKKAATLPLRRMRGSGYRYLIEKNGERIKTCHSTAQVAKYLKTSKGTVCGMFYRNGNKINLFGYTVKRRVYRANNENSSV